MRPIPPDDLVRITDYVAGELSPSEKAATEHWIHEDEARKAAAEYLGESRRAHQHVSRVEADKMVQRFAEAFARRSARRAVPRVPRVARLVLDAPVQSSRGWIARWTTVAGITAAVAGVVIGHHISDKHGVRNAPGLRYVTGAAQVSTATLPDSTRIMLAPNTTLTLARDFGTRTRDVILRGEAYFEVTSSSASPFTVRTERGASVRVLGTAFDVAAYPEHDDVHVAVRTGRIQVTAARSTNTAIVGAGAVARVTDSVVTTSVTDVSPYVSWTAGSLVFNETPVHDVLAALSRWYGIRFQLADSTLARTPLTARFSTRSSADVMVLLKTALRVTLTFDQAKDTTIVTLHPRTARTNGSNESAPAREPRGIFSTHREIGR